MEKKIVLTASIIGCLAIILGAFGAHLLKKYLSPEQLISYETAVKYQMYHALFLLFISQTTWLNAPDKVTIYYTTLIGILLFSGSIYLLTTSNLTHIKTKILGPITPIGGLFLITSWVLLFFKIFVKKD